MSSEETPLVVGVNHNVVYDRFGRRQKWVIVAAVCWPGLLPLFVAASFIPSIPQIAHDLDSTGTVISLAVSLSILAAAIGSLTFATYSTFYGRRPVYLVALPILCAGSLGVGLSRTVGELMVWRFLQATGSSAGISVGSGVIGDIYKLEERGTAMGVFFGAVLLGPALAPICGGLAAHYASWRDMQYVLLACGLLAFLAVLLFLPETSHPHMRDIDDVRMIDEESSNGEGRRRRQEWRWVWVNPLSSLGLLRSPNLLIVSIVGLFALLTNYVLLVPLAYTIGIRYNITNEAIIGACFLPAGLGNIIGAPLAGRISDRLVVKWLKRRGGEWVPEDRLRATLFGAAFLVPVSVLCSGVITHYGGGNVGFGLNLVCLFFNGLGVDYVLSPSALYVVDVVHNRSAESMAANVGFRSFMLALATMVILPLIDHIGVLGTNAISAGLAWIGFGMLLSVIHYGDRMRAWLDVGYSTAENN